MKHSFIQKFVPVLAAVMCAGSLFGCGGTTEESSSLSSSPLAIESSSSGSALTTNKAPDYVAACYDKIVYIDETLSDRDCVKGEQFKAAQKWITDTAKAAGYADADVSLQEMSFTARMELAAEPSAAASYEIKSYLKKDGRKYIECEQAEATHKSVEIKSHNVVVTKHGESEKQIIVGMHYDGDGTGDNGSGVSLGLTMAEKLCSVKTPYTIVFIFFTAEEYGCYGSTAYANGMTQEEIAKTLYMINMDSLICGDYCYLYGGVADKANKTVTATEAYDNAMKMAESLGLNFKSNPWTYENPEPVAKDGVPAYPSPSTGNWSDHKGFKAIGIPYLYFEATNWTIPDYTGYGETYLFGMLMNTKNDYLSLIETYFPSRPMAHLTQFYTLLNGLLLQKNVEKIFSAQ